MTGRGINVLIEAIHIIITEVFAWLQKRSRNKPKKE